MQMVLLGAIVSPLSDCVGRWEEALGGHPDTGFKDYIIEGLKQGFRIGFDYLHQTCVAAKDNLPSVAIHPRVVQEYLDKECRAGRVVGPLPKGSIPGLQVSPFGVIPKGHVPGKWRLIVDLSHPEGRSVNDGISSQWSSLTYVSIDQVVQAVTKLGQGTMMAKLDIRSAYRIIPVHPHDRRLLGMCWRGQEYVDCVLPFGLRSAPKIFNSVADALQWVVIHGGVKWLFHYLDDFLCLGAPGSGECHQSLASVLRVCEELNVPVAAEKTEGPATTLTFLGIEFDTAAMQLRLPKEKLDRLKSTVANWLGRKACTKRELQSLAGLLQHACTVVRPGRSFLRRVFETITYVKRPHHRVRLNMGMRSDLAWWNAFLEQWNGVSMLWDVQKASPDHRVFSDASGSWGCGAFWQDRWCQLQWNACFRDEDIAVKELVPVLVASALWGHNWRGKVVLFVSDNAAVVSILNSGYSRDKTLMHLLRCLFFMAASFNFWYSASHIPGKLNIAADAISRNRESTLFEVMPSINRSPSIIPQMLIQLLAPNGPDWTSQSWARQFNNSIVWH